VASFEDARALAADPNGRLYVAAAARDAVVMLNPDGSAAQVMGGPGMRAGEFENPADVDPTNGLSIFVADAGNGRVQRFSGEGQYLESLPVDASATPEEPRRAFDDGRDGASVQGSGRPIAVASSSADKTFVIEGRRGAVLTWDDRRRPQQLIGAFGGGRLTAPVALALQGTRRLYVADRDAAAIHVFDAFGTHLRRLRTPDLPHVRSLAWRRDRLWIVCEDRILVWSSDTRRTTPHPVRLDAPLVDATRVDDTVYLLTPTRLWRRPAW
jgi:sugar lactone lactonase YvrE